MELNEFVKNFLEQLEDTDPSLVTPKTRFKELEEWSSLTALSIVGMADEIYNVELSGADIRNSITIEDLFQLVQSKQ